MRDWEKDFSLNAPHVSDASDRDKFNKRAGRWPVFWPTRNDGGKGSASQLERSVGKIEIQIACQHGIASFSFHRMCALAGYHAYTSAFVRSGTKTSAKLGVEWHIVALQHRWLRSTNPHRDCAHTGKLDLQRHRIHVHVTYLYSTCKYAGAQASLCMLGCQHCTQVDLPNQLQRRVVYWKQITCTRTLVQEHFFFFFFFFWSTEEIWIVTDQIWPVTDQIWIVTDHASDHIKTLIIFTAMLSITLDTLIFSMSSSVITSLWATGFSSSSLLSCFNLPSRAALARWNRLPFRMSMPRSLSRRCNAALNPSRLLRW